MNQFTFVIETDDTSALELKLGQFIPTAATNAAASAVAAAASASAAAASQTSAAGSAATAIVAATAAGVSQTAATASASAAAGSATSAAGSASTATTQAGNASTSATAAGNSATAAATSATNAGNSATAAATSASNAAATLANALVKGNNLSDVASVATARGNLGLGTLATLSNAPVANGGTGGTTAATARAGIGAAASGANSDITSLAGLTTALSIPQGGTGQTSAAAARGALGAGTAGGFTFRNKIINGNFAINQRLYSNGSATVAANQYTVDRWRVVTSGQSVSLAALGPGYTATAPAGGLEQVIEAGNIEGGTYAVSWVGSGTCAVNGSAVANGGTVVLPTNTNATVHLVGAIAQIQLELGTVPTAFEQPQLGIELLRCRRYFIALVHQFGGYVSASTTVLASINYDPMRAVPVVKNQADTNAGAVTAANAVTPGISNVQITSTSGATAGGYFFRCAFNLDAEF